MYTMPQASLIDCVRVLPFSMMKFLSYVRTNATWMLLRLSQRTIWHVDLISLQQTLSSEFVTLFGSF